MTFNKVHYSEDWDSAVQKKNQFYIKEQTLYDIISRNVATIQKVLKSIREHYCLTALTVDGLSGSINR